MRLAALLALAAASVFGADAAGSYVLRGVPEVASELLLRADGTFEFQMIYGAADYQSKGKWRAEAGSIVLNADPVPPPIRLLRSEPGAPAATRVWLKLANGAGVPHVSVKFRTGRGPAARSTNSAGMAEIGAPAESVAFEIPVYQFVSEDFSLSAGSHQFTFELNAESITQVKFKEERLSLAGDELELKYFGGSKPLRYGKR